MSSVLGKVTRELAEDRGPDLLHRITVPASWLQTELSLRVSLPRLLACAECDGGGCDRCERRGAQVTRAPDEPVRTVTVHLKPDDGGMRRLRLPEEGGSAGAEIPGCLVLEVAPGPLSEGVEREAGPSLSPRDRPRDAAFWIVAVVLLATGSILAALL